MIQNAVAPDPWNALSRFTQARVALGRAGVSTPTKALLDFSASHARARDAVHVPLDTACLAEQARIDGFGVCEVTSRAIDREEYLQRPDLGRRLATACAANLEEAEATEHRLTVVIADGLSSLAVSRHALPLLRVLRPHLGTWQLDDLILATQARVALGDEIGALRKAEAVAVLIGERPGLQAADSLGVYVTWQPRIGRSDAERNCISNIRPGGLTYDEAACKLLHLLHGARLLGATGVSLKDDSTPLTFPSIADRVPASNESMQSAK